MTPEEIVFVDDNGNPTGETGPKLASHTENTKLHLGFSCYIFRRSDNKYLITQRALSKKVWPGVWTNSVCGHPKPGESAEDAIRRRAEFELGIHNLEAITVILPAYRYKTPPFNGIIENEICPVYAAWTTDEPTPNPDEVAAYHWITWHEYTLMQELESHKLSYWAKDQFEQLKNLEPFKSIP
jgi:isopentenyl-diphosphate Delta-isomerase